LTKAIQDDDIQVAMLAYFSLKQLAILRDDLATHGHVYFILSAFFVASSIGPIR